MIDQESTFQNIGKDLPYTVPSDFFDKLPDKTLLLAKERMAKRRRNKNVFRFFAVVTSSAAVILLFLTPHRDLTHRTMTPKAESIDDVLPDLSVEDLAQQSAIYSSEDLTDDPTQETLNFY
jgi:hypothetical protein